MFWFHTLRGFLNDFGIDTTYIYYFSMFVLYYLCDVLPVWDNTEVLLCKEKY